MLLNVVLNRLQIRLVDIISTDANTASLTTVFTLKQEKLPILLIRTDDRKDVVWPLMIY